MSQTYTDKIQWQQRTLIPGVIVLYVRSGRFIWPELDSGARPPSNKDIAYALTAVSIPARLPENERSGNDYFKVKSWFLSSLVELITESTSATHSYVLLNIGSNLKLLM